MSLLSKTKMVLSSKYVKQAYSKFFFEGKRHCRKGPFDIFFCFGSSCRHDLLGEKLIKVDVVVVLCCRFKIYKNVFSPSSYVHTSSIPKSLPKIELWIWDLWQTDIWIPDRQCAISRGEVRNGK